MDRSDWAMLRAAPGAVAVVAQKGRVIRVFFCRSAAEATREVQTCFPEAVFGSSGLSAKCLTQFAEYFQGHRRVFQLPLDDTALTPFAWHVHQTLHAIPYGSVVSYGQLAALSGHPRAARAVGRVMSQNPFPLVIPCHRVVPAHGGLGFYTAADGSSSKAWLINFESSHADGEK